MRKVQDLNQGRSPIVFNVDVQCEVVTRFATPGYPGIQCPFWLDLVNEELLEHPEKTKRSPLSIETNEVGSQSSSWSHSGVSRETAGSGSARREPGRGE